MVICNLTSAVSDYGREFKTDAELADVGLFQCYSEGLLRFATACCVIFMLIGIPGNLTTIVALARCKKVRNATAIFVINLHFSDLIFNLLILPMTAMTFANRHWTLGWVMCRVYAYFKFVLNSSSLSSVLAISINRYVIVCHPHLYPKLYNRKTISISILMIWIAAFALFMAPNFGAWGRFDLEPNGGFCTMMPDLNDRSPKKFFIVGFVVPYLSIALCYARILWVVKTTKKIRTKNPQATRPIPLALSQIQSHIATDESSRVNCDPASPESSCTSDCEKAPTNSDTSNSQSPREERTFERYFKAPFRLTRKLVKPNAPTSRDKRLCAMIIAIMLSHCMSHLPVMVTRLVYKEYTSKPILNVFSHLLLYSATCINPIIYVLMSKEYRQAYKRLFESIIKKFQTLKLSSSQ